MEQDNNKRLDELFNQAKNEPPKVSFSEVKEQFVKSSGGINTASKGGKLAQFSNLKTLIMITTISAITVGSIMVLMNYNNSDKNTITAQPLVPTEMNYTAEESVEEEHKKVVKAHFKKIELLPADLKQLYDIKAELALKIREVPKDSLKKYQLELDKSSRKNEFIVDTSYRFPNLNYTEIQANNRQKAKMLKQLAKFDKKIYAFIPMGNIKVKEKDVSVQAFYIQNTEVSNLEYRTFLFDLLIQGRKDEFLIAKPDQTRWVKDYKYSYNEPMQKHYFSHAAYDYYPVVAVSRKGVEMYCSWLTNERNRMTKGRFSNMINSVRIPTDYEWMYAASGGGKKSPYPWGGPYIRNSNGSFLANFKPMKNNYIADGAFHTAKVDSYNPNDFGLYCMSGNVAEMVYNKEENMMAGTKGGSWTSIGQELQIIEGKDRFKGLIKPSVDVGFRPVITFLGTSNNLTYKLDATVIPPGTVKIDRNLYFDKTEITNFNWREYVYWNKNTFGKNSKEYKNALPDTLVWRTKLAYNEPYVKYYFTHVAYNNYPVVGISYEQAVAFCKWRTDRVKELFEIRKKTDKKNVYPSNFNYRLPTKKEWERVAYASYSEKTLKKLEGKYKGQHRVNLKRGKGDNMGVAGNLNDNADITAPVTSYWPNKYGVYNTTGNVAEMISIKGIAKGGAWNHQEKEVSPDKDFPYKQQNCWTGFRCVLEILD